MAINIFRVDLFKSFMELRTENWLDLFSALHAFYKEVLPNVFDGWLSHP